MEIAMKTIHTILTLIAVTAVGCQAAGPTGANGSTAKTSGTMVVPSETNPQMALAAPTALELAKGTLFGLPAFAAALDASVVTQFKASVDGKAVPVKWDNVSAGASGETRAQFTLDNVMPASRSELVFTSPSGSVKLGTYLEKMDPQASASVQGDVTARSTAGLLVCKQLAAKSGKSLNAYTSADFQAVVNNPRTADLESSLKVALSTGSRGQDVWTSATVAQTLASVSTDIGANVSIPGLGLNVGGSTNASGSTSGSASTNTSTNTSTSGTSTSTSGSGAVKI